MRHFTLARTSTVEEAVAQGTAAPMSYIAGGTNLIDLMKYDVERPTRLVDINAVPLAEISELPGGGLRLGALVTNADTAYDSRVRQRFPVVASAILAGASAQLRNAATNGGNLNQRTRCYYFYDANSPCNKRVPGSGCGAMEGVNRVNGILGMSPSCIATHPSDMCVALAVLNAGVNVTGKDGERVIPIGEYHRLPGDEPWLDHTLRPGELVTSIDLPAESFADHYTYLKLRDRQSYAFALVSAAVVMRLRDGLIEEARVALGGVAAKPWRIAAAEAMLHEQPPSEEVFRRFADVLIEGAVGHGGNDFKIPLARRVIVRACHQAANGTPQSQSDKRIA